MKRKISQNSGKSKTGKRAKLEPDPLIKLRLVFKILLVTEAWSIFLKTSYRELKLASVDPNLAGVGGDNPAWDFLIRKLDFQSQMKISQQNQRLEEVVKDYTEYELWKFRRHIKDDKYMYVHKQSSY